MVPSHSIRQRASTPASAVSISAATRSSVQPTGMRQSTVTVALGGKTFTASPLEWTMVGEKVMP